MLVGIWEDRRRRRLPRRRRTRRIKKRGKWTRGKEPQEAHKAQGIITSLCLMCFLWFLPSCPPCPFLRRQTRHNPPRLVFRRLRFNRIAGQFKPERGATAGRRPEPNLSTVHLDQPSAHA